MNKSILLGRFVKDPELKSTGGGISVTAFTLAVSRAYVKKGEERQADFIDCVAWRGTAEFICRNFQKGQMVALSGEIQTRTYTTKEGQNRKVVEIVVEDVYFCGGRGEETPRTNRAALDIGESQNDDYDPDSFQVIGDDDDLPF